MTKADEELRQAVVWADAVVERVFGRGAGQVDESPTVFDAIASGEWNPNLTDAEKRDLAEILLATAERVRYTRAHAAEMQPASALVRGLGGEVTTKQFGWLPTNRKERYYTGTVLPMLVASDGFAHLHRLLRLCGLDEVELQPSLEGDEGITFVTEYGFAESVFTAEDKKAWPELAEADTPDVVIAGPDWLLAIEAKMFHNPSAGSLQAQMRRQAVLVDMWASRMKLEVSRVGHVLLLPTALSARVGPLTYPVVTWEQVLSEYDVVGPRYWARVLAVALARHPELESRAATGGKNADAVMTGKEIAEAFASGEPAFDHVGRIGGLNGQALANDVQNDKWRTTRYEVRQGSLPGNNNWFTLAEFISITATEEQPD